MKLLVVSWQPAFPVNSGYRRRVNELYGELSKLMEVRVVAPEETGGQPFIRSLPRPATWRSSLPKGKLLETFSPVFKESVEEQALEFRPDHVLAEGLWAASAARAAAGKIGAPLGIAVQNIESVSAKGVYPFPVPNALRSCERSLYRKADWLVAITREESEIIRSMTGRKEIPILVVPNGASLPSGPPTPERIHHLANQWNLKEGERVVLFVGRLNYPPNRKGLEWFSSEVYPSVKEKFGKHMRWIAVGEPIPESSIEPFEFVGFVEDLDAACALANLAISPIRHGSGTSIKVLDFLARGVPLVATRESVRGLSRDVEEAMAISETAEGFYRSISTLLIDESRLTSLSLQGRQWVEKHQTWEVIAQDFQTGLENLP